MSHIEMTIHTSILSGILSPFLSRIDKLIKRKKGMKRRYEQGKKMMHEGCKMNEKMKLKQKTKTFLKNATKHKEHDMLRMMEHDIDLGMT